MRDADHVMLEITMIPVLNDNYTFIIHVNNETAVIDPADDGVVLNYLENYNRKLNYIFNTHHHWDHTDANVALKKKTNCLIIGPRDEQEKIPGIDMSVGDGDTLSLGGLKVTVIGVPGHTKGHIAYYFEDDSSLFCGDTLFAMGCGRLFEGTPREMSHSLKKLAALPEETKVFCAHEYTESNGNFALSVEPDNIDLQKRMDNVTTLRQLGKPTIPTTIGLEKATNPFIRTHSYEIRSKLGMLHADDASIFKKLRERKDIF